VLKQRFITALILAPLLLCGVFFLEPTYFSWFIGLIVALAAWEWANLSSLTSQLARVAYAGVIALLILVLSQMDLQWVLSVSVMWWVIATLFVLSFPDTSNYWSRTSVRCLIGIFTLLPMWKALVFVRTATFAPIPELSPLWIISYMFLLVWAADTGAYFAGKAWGRAKLAPRVSPGKSWAGAWGGVVATIVLSVIASTSLNLESAQVLVLAIITLLTAAISIIGDLTESMFKRQRGIKDSSNLLPGHGGVLDRIDSLVAAIPVFVFLLLSVGWIV